MMKIFGGINDKTRELIETLFEYKEVDTGEFICREGENSNEMFFIKSGKVEIYKEQVKIGELATRDHFGEMSLLEDRTRAASVKTMEKTELAVLTKANFLKLRELDIDGYAQVVTNIAVELSIRLREMDEKVKRIWKWYVEV